MLGQLGIDTRYSRDTSSWKLAGTETFRASASKVFGIYGGNRQNVEKSLRRIYVPDRGKILCQCDQSGAEALIVAYLCQHGNYRDLFLNRIKSHVFVALHVFKKQFEDKLGFSLDTHCAAPVKDLRASHRWEDVDKKIKESDKWIASERYYFLAKKICHASNYGMKANTFSVAILKDSEGQVRITPHEANEYLETYHRLFPEIRGWHKEVETTLRIHKKLYNLFRYPRYFYTPVDTNNLKEALAFIPQSTVGCITHIALTKLQLYIESNNLDWDILNNCHDSYLVQCPKGEEVECCKQMKFFMEQHLTNFRKEEFQMKSETSVGFNWGEMH